MEELKTVVGGGRLIAESESSCGDKLERSDWAGTHTVQLDDLQVGVRWNDDEVGDLLGRLLGERIVTDGTANADYSVVRQAGEAGSPGSYLLYGGQTVLIDSPSLGRAVRGLVRYLDADRLAETPGRLRLAVTAVVGPGGADLGPAMMRTQLLGVEGRLNEREQFLLDAPWVYVDPETAELVWEPVGLVDSSVLAELDHPDDSGASSDGGEGPQQGRFLVGSLSFLAGITEDGPLSASRGVLEAASLLVNPADLGASASLAALQSLTARIDVSGFTYLTEDDLLKPFTAVAEP